MQVRKEKLGDRISALQRLVAPFGKVYIIYKSKLFFFLYIILLSFLSDSEPTNLSFLMLKITPFAHNLWLQFLTISFSFVKKNYLFQTDTSSVLTEAIGYIQFLHDQVEVTYFSIKFNYSFLQ